MVEGVYSPQRCHISYIIKIRDGFSHAVEVMQTMLKQTEQTQIRADKHITNVKG